MLLNQLLTITIGTIERLMLLMNLTIQFLLERYLKMRLLCKYGCFFKRPWIG
ncbi:hypothetical protein HanXRQr2_Chr17g0825631 [Helianthus annuus]|uniref:Uncharacterized protein n=1 Tax=Helianthus annuus TaxID=4232 RepID=A0A9K3DL91_HELAN|nr:hypothetical protein HanXRQr2_Chr17g0825631 [Helianthus annuus]